MRQNVPDIHSVAIKVDHGDQPVFIAADTEHDPILDFVGRGKCCPQIDKAVKLGFFHNLEPSGKSRLAVRMFFPELDQGSARDDVHAESISQNEILYKRPGTIGGD